VCDIPPLSAPHSTQFCFFKRTRQPASSFE
jgi:hypothetical protein